MFGEINLITKLGFLIRVLIAYFMVLLIKDFPIVFVKVMVGLAHCRFPFGSQGPPV